MSKCREAFESHCAADGVSATTMQAVGQYMTWQAAWNAAMREAVEICREKAKRVNSVWIPHDCAEAILKEIEP